jgi:hypothetical protein
LWGYEDKHDPSCVKSQKGYDIFIADYHGVCASGFQTDIANSTMEAEFSAISTVMREVLSINMLLAEISEHVGLTRGPITDFRATVWEDNAGALKLATLELGRMTHWFKWYVINYH